MKNIEFWEEVDRITTNDVVASDMFSYTVALSGNGLVAMVGAPFKDTTGTDTGIVYTYKRDSIDSPWEESGTLLASDAAAFDRFGYSVALSEDGLVAMVGAVGRCTIVVDAGIVYTYKRDTIDSPWVEVDKLTISDVNNRDRFGYSVALSGDGLVAIVGTPFKNNIDVGIGIVYTYKRDAIDSPWVEVSQLTAKINDIKTYNGYGSSVALSRDGLVAMVGAPFTDTVVTDAGVVYVYKRDTIDSPWVEVDKLVTNDAQTGDNFGISIALSGDGSIALIGAYSKNTTAVKAGKVYIYKKAVIGDQWVEVDHLTANDSQAYDYFGTSTAISSDGSIAIVGADCGNIHFTDIGKVYTYRRKIDLL